MVLAMKGLHVSVLHKRSILTKTSQVSGLTLISRIFGVAREVLMIRYLGAGVMAEAFITAFKLPNALRKVFAEGALSVAFIPTLVKLVREKGKQEASSLMMLAFLLFEGLVLALCAVTMWQAPFVVKCLVPGWTAEKMAIVVPLLRILMPFIFFLSSSALLTGALQAVNHFFVPAFSPILLNSIFIGGILVCINFGLPVTYLCTFIIGAAFITFLGHVVAYLQLEFSFARISKESWTQIGAVLLKFFPCMLTVSFFELMLLISTSFASYLPEGSIALIYYANRFMGIPLGVFATAFSTILLPHFSRVATYAPNRLSFYFLETTKFIAWITLPASLLMVFFADKIFLTFSSKFTPEQATLGSHILIAYVIGLFVFSLNKILPNIYYAKHNTWIPATASLVAGTVNVGLDLILMHFFQAVGLALSYTIAATLQVCILVYLLKKWFNLRLYLRPFANFAARYTLQLLITCCAFLQTYYACGVIINRYAGPMSSFLLKGFGLWLWVGPLALVCMLFLFKTRHRFGVKLHFLD